ncbi:MAG: response regulator transcription factor [Colwellia sp.]|nr:response regulator transcription factor [Colwellia sp.]
MLKIIIVDDHAIVRAGIRQLLQEASILSELGEATNGVKAMSLIRNQDWDLVLLDIKLPDRSGVDVLKLIKSEKPKLPVLIISSYPESQYAVRLIHGGAAGYLSKDAPDEEILKAIDVTTKGKKYISPIVAELLANFVYQSGQKEGPECSHEILSDREYQVFLELATGAGPNLIAQKLNVSAKTITTHRSRILQKMGFTNNAEIVLYANRYELIDTSN